MRIADIAARTGFSPGTLRYYEEIGLMPVPARTEAGYRTYGHRDVERLAFIARAKRLGCTLEEIADLLTAWDGDCADVQGGLRALVGEKRMSARRRIAELVGFGAQLEQAAATLAGDAHDGPCGDGCACVAEPDLDCTLPAGEWSGRVDDWQSVLARVRAREPIDGGVRLVLAPDAPVGEIAELARAEHGCCTFFSFAITVDERGVAVEVRAPGEARDLVDAAFGASA